MAPDPNPIHTTNTTTTNNNNNKNHTTSSYADDDEETAASWHPEDASTVLISMVTPRGGVDEQQQQQQQGTSTRLGSILHGMLVDDDEEQPAPLSSSSGGHRPATKWTSSSSARLSTISQLYDRGHKGFLDPTETVLRRMDSQNQGFIANEKVYNIMHSLQEEQRRSAQLLTSLQREHSLSTSLKRGVFLLAVFSLLLAVSNIGTSMVAARLSKDLTIDWGSSRSTSPDLVSTQDNLRVATTSKTVVVQLNPMDEGEVSSRHRRYLQEVEEAACQPQLYDANYTGTDWDRVQDGAIPTMVCKAVGTVDYEDATRLYQAFCPQYPDITDTSACSNIGLSEVLLQCGTALTRILGGAYFPTGGVPGWTESGTSFVFPTPATASDHPASQYFYGLQLVSIPSPLSFSLTVDGPTLTPLELCEESIQFKLYCTPPEDGEGSGACFFIASYLEGSQNCPGGQVSLCRAPPTDPTTRRMGQTGV